MHYKRLLHTTVASLLSAAIISGSTTPDAHAQPTNSYETIAALPQCNGFESAITKLTILHDGKPLEASATPIAGDQAIYEMTFNNKGFYESGYPNTHEVYLASSPYVYVNGIEDKSWEERFSDSSDKTEYSTTKNFTFFWPGPKNEYGKTGHGQTARFIYRTEITEKDIAKNSLSQEFIVPARTNPSGTPLCTIKLTHKQSIKSTLNIDSIIGIVLGVLGALGVIGGIISALTGIIKF